MYSLSNIKKWTLICHFKYKIKKNISIIKSWRGPNLKAYKRYQMNINPVKYDQKLVMNLGIHILEIRFLLSCPCLLTCWTSYFLSQKVDKLYVDSNFVWSDSLKWFYWKTSSFLYVVKNQLCWNWSFSSLENNKKHNNNLWPIISFSSRKWQ